MAKPPAKSQALADSIATEIASGRLLPGAWLAAERTLAEAHQVDRSTVRRALLILESLGLVLIHPGSGAQVQPTEPVRRSAADITRQAGTWRGFHVSAQQDGRQPFTQTAIREVEIQPLPARWLGIPTGARVLERARIQGLEGEPPIQLSTTWLLPAVSERLPILREVNTGPGGMLSRMEEAGYQLRFEDFVTSRLPVAHEQERLQIPRGQPVLNVWRRCYDQNDRVLEVTQRVIVSDRHELIYRYDS